MDGISSEIPPAFCGGLIEAGLKYQIGFVCFLNPPRVLRGPH